MRGESGHFLFDTRLISRLLTSVSNLGTQRADGLFLLFAAVCGSSFSLEETDHDNSAQDDLIITASRYAVTAINQLNVFQFLLDLLVNTEPLKPMNPTHLRPQGSFELFHLPDSMSVIGLCEHLAAFDLLTFMAKQITLESLDRDPGSPTNQNLFVKILSKALSALVQCSGSIGMLSRSADPSAMGSLNIGSRVLPVIESVAQRFPYDLDFLDLCTALLSSTEERNDATVELVAQLICSVPYFAQPMTDEIAAALSPVKAEAVEGAETREQDMAVLLRQHWALPTDVLAHRGFNQYAVSLSPGTRSILRPKLGLIVWQHEYSVWPVLNAIVAAAEYSFSAENFGLSADKNPPRSGSRSILQPSQPALAAARLETAFSRLATCLDFVDACLLAGIEPGRCLAITDTMWNLVTGVFTEFFSTEITGGRQDRFRQGPSPHVQRAPNSAFNEVLISLTCDRLLPCLLRLTTHAIAYLQDTDGSDNLAAGDHPGHMPMHPLAVLRSKYSLSAFHRLYSDRIILPEAVHLASPNRPDLPKYTLSDCCLLRLIVDSPTDWYPSVPPSPSTRYRLISAYLDLALAVLEGERLAYLAGCSIDGYEQSSPSYLPTASPLIAFLVFCVNFVIEVCQPGTSELAVKGSLQPLRDVCQRSDLFSLLNKALIFLVDLLTTHHLEEPSKESEDKSLSHVYAPGFYGIQTYARELLASHEAILSCFVALTTVPVSSLQLPADSLVFDFLRFPTRLQTDQRFVLVLGQPKERSTWLSLTLIHLLFPPQVDATSAPQSCLLECLKGVLTTQGEAYFLKILRFLDFQCSTGLSRAAVNILKKMVQYSDKLVSPFLGKISTNLQNIILQRLASPSSDQITRSSLFDWLAEAVLFDALKGPGPSLFQGSGFTILRILSSPPKFSKSDNNESNDRASEQPLDVLSVLISTLNEIDATLSTIELEVTSYLPAILSVELYEYIKYGQPIPADVFSLCSKLVDSRVLQRWTKVFIQTVNILQSIWDYFDSYQLICTLTDCGTLNNLLVIFTEHSRTRNGASFCQALLLLLLRLLTPATTGLPATTVTVSSHAAASGLYPNLSIRAPVTTSSSLSLRQAELVASYSDLLTQGLRLPSVEKLSRWLSQDEACEVSAPSEGQSLSTAVPTTGDGGSWCELILSELRLLTLLSHQLGSPGHRSIASLITGFMQDNQDQLSAMAFWWISDLRERVYTSTVSSHTKVLEPFSDLIESGSVRPHRMALAEAVFEFYWSVLKSSDVHNLVSPPCLALSTLFADSSIVGTAAGGGSIQMNSSRGSTIHVPADMWNTVCSMVIGESQVCALLLLRPGTSPKHTKDTTTAPTGSKISTRSSETSRLQQAPASPSLASGSESSAVKSRSSLLEPCLLPLVRLLAVCLRLLALSTPLLDSLSFASVAEISTTMPITTLSFASPSLEISDSLSFGTLFSIARSSSQLLQSYNFFGRSSRRSQKFRGRNSLSARQSPYTRSTATPDSPVKGTRATAIHADVPDEPQGSDLVFLKFSESFIEFLK
ncbi:unnamed protein product [Schistocephalus solidus]|uniref:RING-type E3 ubiquitin transferase n=1 Tax=Schistocephalus solidus TaxID=70667 RepID=A0A183STD1_SCHSO|nr:unnamed protein product [Schistocephalus solidus]